MTIIKVEKIGNALYELTYKTFFGKVKTRKVFHSVFSFRFSDTGKELPFQIYLSVSNLCNDMKVGEVKKL